MEAEQKAENEVLTPVEVATRLNVKVSVVLRWIASKELHAVNTASFVGAGHRPRWRITPASLAVFLAARGNAPPPAPVEKPARKLPPRRKNSGEEFV